MKIFKIIFLLIFAISLFHSCQIPVNKNQFNGYKNVIDVNNITSVSGRPSVKIHNINIPPSGSITFNYNKYIKVANIVKLERSAESTVTNIDKVILTNDRIIILDAKVARGVYIFNSKGQFISSIMAAKEVIDKKVMISNILDIAYDYSKDELILHDPNKSKMYYFDRNGKFKNSTKEYLYFEAFANLRHSDNFVYLNSMGGNDHIPALAKSTLYLGKRDTRIAYTAEAVVKQMRPKVNYSINSNISLTNSNEHIFYTPEFCDTVYEIAGKPLNIYPRLIVHYPGPDLNSTLKRSHKDNMKSFIKLANTDQYYSFQGEILNNNSGVYYLSSYKEGVYGYFYSEKTGKIIGGSLTYSNSPVDTVQVDTYRYPITTFNNYFVSILSSADFNKSPLYMSKSLSAFKKNLKPGVNPVLVYYTINTF